MYQIFINNKPLYIVSSNTELKSISKANAHFLLKIGSKGKHFLGAVNALRQNLTDFVLWICKDENKDFGKLKRKFEYIEAAGGVVYNQNNELLCIKRLGFYDLPKGKIDAGETPTQAALREVEEECGISGLEITAALPATYHIYEQNDRSILKKTHWFAMRYTQNEALTPQATEDITEAFWIKKTKLPTLYKKMYPALVQLLTAL